MFLCESRALSSCVSSSTCSKMPACTRTSKERTTALPKLFHIGQAEIHLVYLCFPNLPISLAVHGFTLLFKPLHHLLSQNFSFLTTKTLFSILLWQKLFWRFTEIALLLNLFFLAYKYFYNENHYFS